MTWPTEIAKGEVEDRVPEDGSDGVAESPIIPTNSAEAGDAGHPQEAQITERTVRLTQLQLDQTVREQSTEQESVRDWVTKRQIL
jgi:hypothetical protein